MQWISIAIVGMACILIWLILFKLNRHEHEWQQIDGIKAEVDGRPMIHFFCKKCPGNSPVIRAIIIDKNIPRSYYNPPKEVKEDV